MPQPVTPRTGGGQGFKFALGFLIAAVVALGAVLLVVSRGSDSPASTPVASVPTQAAATTGTTKAVVLGSKHIMSFFPSIAPTGMGGGSDFHWSEIEWSNWGDDPATGTGYYDFHNRNSSNQADWFWEKTPVTITAHDIRERCGKLVYWYIKIVSAKDETPAEDQIWGGDPNDPTLHPDGEDCSWAANS